MVGKVEGLALNMIAFGGSPRGGCIYGRGPPAGTNDARLAEALQNLVAFCNDQQGVVDALLCEFVGIFFVPPVEIISPTYHGTASQGAYSYARARKR